MKLLKRSFRLAGHATSVALEAEFWSEIERLAALRHQTLSALINEIDESRTRNLASEIRVFVLQQVKGA